MVYWELIGGMYWTTRVCVGGGWKWYWCFHWFRFFFGWQKQKNSLINFLSNSCLRLIWSRNIQQTLVKRRCTDHFTNYNCIAFWPFSNLLGMIPIKLKQLYLYQSMIWKSLFRFMNVIYVISRQSGKPAWRATKLLMWK